MRHRFPEISKRLRKAENFDVSCRPHQTSGGWIDIEIELKGKRPLFLYEGENPYNKSEALLANWSEMPYDLKFVIGIGFGYLPMAGLKKVEGKSRMVLIEPCTGLFKCTLQLMDLRPLLSCERVDVFVGENIRIAEIVERYRDHIPIGKVQLVVHPNYSNIFGEKINAIKNDLTERIRTVRDIWSTTKKYGRQMHSNAISNFPSVFSGTALKMLRGKFKGVPAVCIAAGPSLDNTLDELKKLENKTLLIACDSAVNALLKAGIRPHIVVTTDIFETNIAKLKPHVEQLREAVLIFGIESNPDNVRFYLGQRRVAITSYNKLVLNHIDPMWDLQCKLPPMTSVSHLAVFSAMALGADPIVLIGMDMAYVKGHSHATGSVFYHTPDLRKTVLTPGTKGFQVTSSPQFIADKLIFENVIAESSNRIINTSFNGAYINGAKMHSISELVNTELQKSHNITEYLNSINWSSAIDNNRMGDDILKLVDEIQNFKIGCQMHEKAIQTLIKTCDDETRTSANSTTLKEIENKFNEIRIKEHGCINMLKDVMLADIQEITKNQESIQVRRYTKDTDKIRDELNIMLDWIDAYTKASDFYIGQLNHAKDYILALLKMEKSTDSLPLDYHLALARFLKSNDEIWRAVKEYKTCIQIDPGDYHIYTELFQLYVESNLWFSAHELAVKASGIFQNRSEVKALIADANHHIDGIMESIKEKWVQGDRDTTRKLLSEYLLLRSNDPQANELKDVLNELDLEFSTDWSSKERKKDKMQTLQQRMEPASQYLANMQFERAIGILEGIIADFPSIKFDIREKIGDCRMLQREFKSALWNYSQASNGISQKNEIADKITDARQRLLRAE